MFTGILQANNHSGCMDCVGTKAVVARYKEKMCIKLTAITGYHGSQGSHMGSQTAVHKYLAT